MTRRIGPEAAKNHERRLQEGFYERYLTGENILDIGFRGGDPDSTPITPTATGVDLDYPGYDGRVLPFPSETQDAVFASHCLEHIDDYQNAISDWFRVLKIGGFLVIAVPHRDLYERKKTLPSLFNGDHRRLYTPAVLLSEVEASLPVGGFRIRSLRDIDDGFDYSVPPEIHPEGSYEIELVIEKIKVPYYADQLRPSKAAEDFVHYFTQQVELLVQANRSKNTQAYDEIFSVLRNFPLPNFGVIKSAFNFSPDKDTATVSDGELMDALMPLVGLLPFDKQFYKESYSDLQYYPEDDLKSHYVIHGYFEGRKAVPSEPSVFD